MSDPRQELEQLRRLAELEAKAGAVQQEAPVTIDGQTVDQMNPFKRYTLTAVSPIINGLAGIGQMTGLVDDETAAKTKRQNAALRSGVGGSVVGTAADIGAFLLPISKVGALGKLGQYGGNAAIGATIGAIQPTEKGESRAKNAAIGGALGIGGQATGDLLQAGGKALANTLSPEIKALYQAAKARGIKLTPAQLTDSKFVQFVRSQLAALPGSGAASQAAKQSRQFNTAVSKTVGETEPMSREVFDSALTRMGAEFDKFTNTSVPLTNGFMRKVLDVQDEAWGLGEESAARSMKHIADRIFKAGNSGTLDGKAVQSIDSQLSKLQAFGGERAYYASKMRNALHDQIEKNIPRADFEAWNAVRGQYRNAMQIMGLVAKDGEVSPGKLMGAVTSNKAGKRAMARGRGGDLGQLAMIGQRMKSPATSGTGERVQASAIGAGFMQNPLATAAGVTLGRLGRGVSDSEILASILMNRGKGMQAVAPYVRALTPASTPFVVPYMADNDPRRSP